MKKELKLFIAISLILAALFLSLASAFSQVTIDSVQVNGQTTTTVCSGQTIKIYMHPVNMQWATYNPNYQLHFAFWGSQNSVANTTPRELQSDSNWVYSLHLYNPTFSGLIGTLVLYDASNIALSNSLQLSIGQSAGIENLTAEPVVKCTTFYNFNGQRIINPAGLVIKKTEYLNGAVKAEKIFISK